MLKKKWIKPELVILTKSHPEENVLTNCKMSTSTTSSAGSNAKCRWYCVSDCSSIVTS